MAPPRPASPLLRHMLLLAAGVVAGAAAASVPLPPRLRGSERAAASLLPLSSASLSASSSSSYRDIVSSSSSDDDDDDDDQPLPLVIWHGLGDDFASEGMRAVGAMAEAVHPGTLVYAVSLAGADGGAGADRSASWLGNVTAQVEAVCGALAAHPILSTAPAVDALGFSQGGQFLRAYAQRCAAPPVRSLVTFGSQHNGIAEFRACAAGDWLCRGAELLLRRGAWSALAQSRLVPAQYFRDPAELEPYLAASAFLADANNERPASRNATYAANLARLAAFAMFMFEDDTTVVPRQTSWFADVVDGDVVPLRRRRLYAEDWLGLRRLDRAARLHFRSVPGDHMDIPPQLLNDTMAEFFGPYRKKLAPAQPSAADFGSDEL